MSDRPRRWARPVMIAAIVWLLWLATIIRFVPRTIAAAYEERSLPFLNAAMSGRVLHDLEYYLDIWRAQALRLTIVLLCLTLVAGAVWSFRRQLAVRLAPVIRALAMPGEVGAGWVLLFSSWMAMVAGLLEAARAAMAFYQRDLPTSEFHPDLIWMMPLANVLTLGLLALLIGCVFFFVARRAGLALVPVVIAAIGAYALVRALGGVHPIAATALAAGIAVTGLRLVRQNPARAARLIRRSGVVMAAALLAFGVLRHAVANVREARAVRALPVAQANALNVLLIILDTVRAHSLSVMGYERPTTPNLERLAARGVVFERAWATAPWTLPSHASMFTGLDATQISADYMTPLSDEPPTLAEALKAGGYVGAGFVSNYFFASRPSGLARGFLHYSDVPIGLDAITGSAWLPRRFRRHWNALRDDYRRLSHKTAERVNRDFLDWLPRTQGRPFFAFLNYLDAHEPYAAPPSFQRKFARPGTRYWLGFNQKYTDQELGELRDHYDDAIAYLDEQIGRLLDELEARGVLANTLVIITSDHGEQFGEVAPSLVRHGWSLYSPALHVPMLMALPGPLPQGLRITEPVSIASIPATVLDLVGHSDKSPLPGRSLARFWTSTGASGDTVVSFATRNPREMPPRDTPIRRGPLYSLLAGNLHYIVNFEGEEELYDLESDPWELTDLSRSPGFRPALRRLRAALDARVDHLSLPKN